MSKKGSPSRMTEEPSNKLNILKEWDKASLKLQYQQDFKAAENMKEFFKNHEKTEDQINTHQIIMEKFK